MKIIRMSLALSAVLILSLALFSGYLGALPKKAAEIKPAPDEVVDVIEIKLKPEKLLIRSSGVVEAVKRVKISPASSGTVIFLSPALEIGRSVRKGELLARIDPTDHIALVEEGRAKLKRAEYEYKVEIGKKRIAEDEWKLLGGDLRVDPIGEELALRGPQVEDKKAQLLAAEKRLEKAEHDLMQTEIRAPFDGIVLKDSQDVGSMVSQGSEIAEIARIDVFRVIVSIPYERVCKIACIARDALENSKAYVIQELGDGVTVVTSGVAVRLLGDLDAQGAMARAVVLVDDPLGLKEGTHIVPLFLGSSVHVEIEGPDLGEVAALPLSAITAAGEVVLLGADGLLETRKVDVKIIDENIAYISGGLSEGDKVVVKRKSLSGDP